MAEKKTEGPEQSRRIYFEPKPDPSAGSGQAAPRVTRISHGEYTWEAQGKPPYQISPEEWEAYIRPTGFFREVKKGARIDG